MARPRQRLEEEKLGTFEIANGVAVIIKGVQDTTRLKAAIPRDIRYVVFNDAKLVGDISWLFDHCYALRDVRGTVDMSGVTDMGRIFWQCRSLERIDCADWDVSSVVNMVGMFSGCERVEYIDCADWNTSSVVNMAGMFAGCESLEYIDVSKWDTSSVKFMNLMFYNCPAGEEALPIFQSKRHA